MGVRNSQIGQTTQSDNPRMVKQMLSDRAEDTNSAVKFNTVEPVYN